MTSRDRILKTLNFEEPDMIPYDLAGSTWTGITNTAYQNLLKHFGMEAETPNWSDVIQQIVIPSEEILNRFNVDTRGIFPLTSHNWNVYDKLKDVGDSLEYLDEWGFVHHFPKKNGHWFSLVKSPMEEVDFENEALVDEFPWPDAKNKTRFAGLRKKALQFRAEGKIVIAKGLCAGLFEMHQRVRGVSNAMMDPLIYPSNSDKLIGKIADLKIEFWDEALNELGDVIDIIGEGDDYGTQMSQLISKEQFQECYKPHIKRVSDFIKQKAPHVKQLFHSCGNVRPIIPDLIEIGVDILNPIHITATGMEPQQLKKDFGKSIVFWGGGIDTQQVLPKGSMQEIENNVKANIDALAPGGGFVFTTVHNIQAEVQPESIMAMYKTFVHNRNY